MKWILTACVALLFLIGCNTQQRDIKRLDAYFVQYGSESARLSNLIYPCFKGVMKSDTIIVKGKSDTVVGGVLYSDTTIHDTVYRTKTQTKYVTNTVLKTVVDTVQDMRMVASLNDDVKDLRDSTTTAKTQLKDSKTAKSTWMWIAIAAMGVIVVFVVAKIVIFIYGGEIKKVL